MTDRAVFPPGDAREDWAILRALSAHLGSPLDYDSLAELRSAMFADHPHLALIDEISTGKGLDLKKLSAGASRVGAQRFTPTISDFLSHQSHHASFGHYE